MESTLGNDSQEDFDGLFSDMQLDSTKLGHTVKDRSAVMAKSLPLWMRSTLVWKTRRLMSLAMPMSI